MRTLLLITVLCWLSWNIHAQKVGVVMSGGAAKGMAHIGMLKALEENEIPIDYVVGTSMGGIIAGCYAAGMSPQQIEDVMVDKELLRWINGQMEDGYNYYYNKDEPYPSFLKLNLSLDSTFNFNLNTTLANDLSLNFAMAEKMAQPSAIAKGNFDSLFVPLRVVAAEIFTQSQVVIKNGSLGDALRATQTVPFFYTPIRVNGRYLFDGGVYNNFPVDVAISEFNPDVIIGCNVSSKVYNEYPKKDDEKLISKSLIYLLLDKSDPGKVPTSGIYIQPNLKDFSGFDFSKAKALIDSGYAETMRKMPEIKSKIAGRKTCEDVATERNLFNDRSRPLIVDHILTPGYNRNQGRYISRFFGRGDEPLYLKNIKSGYYRLVSEDYFKNIYPSFVPDTVTNRFDFQLTRRQHNNFQVDFGGVIATRNISNIYLGLNYYDFNRMLNHFSANFSTGSFYKSGEVKARIDFPFLGQFYIEPMARMNSWDYTSIDDIIQEGSSSTVLDRIDRKVGASVGWPVGKQFKASLGAYFISNTDRYIDKEVLITSDTLDQLILTGGKYSFHFTTNNLNRKQYPNAGKYIEFGVDYLNLWESFLPGNTSSLYKTTVNDVNRSWFRASLIAEQYFRKGFYSSGYYLHATFSNQPLFQNYQGTIINAPAFLPIQDSRTWIVDNFRAFNFVAGGWKNVFTLRKSLDLRLEAYAFKPFQSIVRGSGQEAVLTTDLTKISFAGTAGLVLHSTIGPISFSVNYYEGKKDPIGVLLHVGFLMYRNTSLE